jgi:heme exporter protein B
MNGTGAGGHLSLLGAMLFLSLVFAPWAIGAALRISLE